MGTVHNLGAARDAKVAGTTDPRKLGLIVKILTINSDRNTAAQRGKLAAAQRLLGGQA
jgi:hypothetical protein